MFGHWFIPAFSTTSVVHGVQQCEGLQRMPQQIACQVSTFFTFQMKRCLENLYYVIPMWYQALAITPDTLT